jgi:Tfp pilus assembly protein PilO
MKSWHILIFVLVISFGGFVLRPWYSDIQKLQEESSELQKTLKDKIQELQNLNTIIKASEQKNQSIIEQIPSDNQQEVLLLSLRKLSQKTNFYFDGLQFSKGHNRILGIPELKIQFSTEGKKSQLVSFLRAIEESTRFLGMESLSISTQEENNVTFGVSLYAFFQDEQ